MTPNDLELKKPKGTLFMLKYYPGVQISLRFALRSLVFQIIEVFDFSIDYNGEFAIFEKKIIKNQKRKISKIPNVVL